MAQPPQADNAQDGDGKVPSLIHSCQHWSLVHELDGWTFSGTQLNYEGPRSPRRQDPSHPRPPLIGKKPTIHQDLKHMLKQLRLQERNC